MLSLTKGAVQKGFTLIELMITIAIIGILAAVAIPSYLAYTDKARFTATTSAASSRQTYVATCILTLRTATGCTDGSNGIPASTAVDATNHIPGVAVNNGVITATSPDTGGYTYILTPTFNSTTGTIAWVATGTCQAQGIC